MIVEVKRAVKEGDINPNGFYTRGIQNALIDYINNQTNTVSMFDERDIADFKNRHITDPELIVGEIIGVDEYSISVKLYDNNYKEEILENLSDYRALIVYEAKIDMSIINRKTWDVGRILKVQLKKMETEQ